MLPGTGRWEGSCNDPSYQLASCLDTCETCYTFPLTGEGIAIPLQAWSGPEGSRNLRLPDYMTTVQDGGKVVSLTHWPPLPPGNAPGTHFC